MITIKLLILGNSGVGKTSLLLHATEKDADTETVVPTIGVDFKCKEYLIDGEKITLQLWDTAGQERFRAITQAYYRGSQGIMVVYDITDEKSFHDSKSWIFTIKEKCEVDVNIILVGNKIDLVENRRVTREEGQSLADENNITFIELSAFEEDKLYQSFRSIVEMLYDKHKEKIKPKENVLNVVNNKKRKGKCDIA
ncbi:hypothetical protein A3Q56_03132 [Intoshia linei]|uniref:Uncharacterized protein n=1 Tax=Intoshia linei TaxID=1819745 RepID=A0A177B6S2_9BILA|nr:hypothetical protein A3Q56_03132 [Intoshia linei]